MKKIENKKKKVVIALIIVLILLLVTMFIVGNAYSKYRTETRGTGDFPIAKWSFLANGQEGVMYPMELKNTYNADTLVNGKIAPGTSGNFDILIDATGSEVGIEYSVEFYNVAEEPENLVYRYEGVEVSSLVELQNMLKGRIGLNDSNKQKLLEIDWEWKYETGNDSNEISVGDQIDTNNSKNLNEFRFDIYVIGNQEEPLQEEMK